MVNVIAKALRFLPENPDCRAAAETSPVGEIPISAITVSPWILCYRNKLFALCVYRPPLKYKIFVDIFAVFCTLKVLPFNVVFMFKEIFVTIKLFTSKLWIFTWVLYAQKRLFTFLPHFLI